MPIERGHLMEAVTRILAEEPDLTRRDLAKRTGASMGSMHHTLQRMLRRGEVERRPLLRKGRGGHPPWMYRLVRRGGRVAELRAEPDAGQGVQR